MSLRDDISSLIANNLISVNCDNCFNKEHCLEIQYKSTRENGGTCVDWAVSDDLAEELADDIIDLIYDRLGAK